jgi:hypothetical protein
MSDQNHNSSSYESIHPDSKTLLEGTGFTQINNAVINNIKDGDAFLVWCYLYSKTTNWKTIKENIKNVYGFGDKKLREIFSYLNRARLIEYVQGKCANGKFSSVQIRILNGAKFDKTQAYTESAPVGQKHARAVNRTGGNDGLRNKENTKERKEHNTDSNSASNDAHVCLDNGFNDFWNLYKVKKNKVRAKKIWERKKLHEIHEMILNNVAKRNELDSQWQAEQFIPHPSTYLHNELWTDSFTEITFNSNCPANKGDALSRVVNKYMNQGETYDHATGSTIDPFR